LDVSVDIVIVNWNAGVLLRRCVESIAAHGGSRVAKVIVVDNGSTDGSDAIDVPGVPLEVVRTGRNLGFGKACNIGVARGTAPFVLFFNPDAELAAGTIDTALDYMTSPAGQGVGVCGIRLVDEEGHAHRHCARFPTARTFLGNSLGLTRALKRWFPPVLMVDFDHLADRSVDHVMGAFYLMPRHVFDEVGGFDEDFFVYLEDLDLSARVKAAGYRIEYLSGPVAYHKQGGTSEKVKAHRLFYSLKSNAVYVAKHLPPVPAATVIGVTYLVEPLSRTVRGMLRASLEEVWFTWRGFGMLYRDVPATLSTLRSIAKRRRSGHAPLDERP
jgi:GT2 family glycosyltransferase